VTLPKAIAIIVAAFAVYVALLLQSCERRVLECRPERVAWVTECIRGGHHTAFECRDTSRELFCRLERVR
jgi:hypothetical protein